MQFYSEGGLFMNGVSLMALATSVFTIRSIVAARGQTTGQVESPASVHLELGLGLLKLILGLGLMGTAFGLHEVAAAVRHAPSEQLLAAAIRGVGMALNTTTYALMLAIPLGFALSFTRYRLRRKISSPSGDSLAA